MMKNFFQFEKLRTHWKQECLAGLSTFATMAYVLVVNSSILSDAGMDFGAVLVATILTTVLASSLMGLLANYPIAIAPGMGVSAYMTYTLILGQGKTWETCLGAIFIVGVLLLLLTVFKVRQKLLTEIPLTLRHSIAAGIGLFLIFVGLKHVGVIQQSGVDFISLGRVFTLEALFTLMGIGLILILEAFKVRSAFILAILISWGLGFLFGLTHFEGIAALPPSLIPTFLKLDFSHFFQWDFVGVVGSLFLVTLLDSSVALVTLTKQARIYEGKGEIPRMQRALLPDAIGTLLGSLIGSASLAMHMESAAGIKAGGRTGIVPIFVSVCFLGCLFFYPVIVTIPHFAPASVLIVLGFLMLREVKEISWKQVTESIPACVTILMMPLTMSIYDGFSWGFIIYALLKLLSGRFRELHLLVWILALLFLTHRIVECFI